MEDTFETEAEAEFSPFNLKDHEVKDGKDFSWFAIDTETSGAAGVSFWCRNNQIVQLHAYHYASNEHFKRYILHPDVTFIPPETTEIHRITLEQLKLVGAEPKKVYSEFRAWVKEKCNGKAAVFQAHNAKFDRNMLLKTIMETENITVGIGGEQLNWHFFCTFEYLKQNHPELEENFLPWEKPNSLNVAFNFYFAEINAAIPPGFEHNAEMDVRRLVYMFVRLVYPRIAHLQTVQEILDHPSSVGYLFRQKERDVRMIPMLEYPTIGKWKIQNIYNFVTRFMLQHGGDNPVIVPLPLFAAAHLIAFAKVVLEIELAKEKSELDLTDEWYAIMQIIYRMLSSQGIEIYSDNLKLIIMQYVLDDSDFDIVYNRMREDGRNEIYPPLPGKSVSYYPLNLSPDAARKLYEDSKIASATQIAEKFIYTPDISKPKIRVFLQGYVGAGFDLATLADQVKKITSFGG